MNRTFHHGGRLGDAIYALYTIRALGGGTLYLSNFHYPNWDQKTILSLLPFLSYQEYIDLALPVIKENQEDILKWVSKNVNYDLHDAELDFNPECFPEWEGIHWPGNIHIAKRYSVHFGIEWFPGSIWLTAPRTKEVDIVIHAPQRRVTDLEIFTNVINELSKEYRVIVVGGPNDIKEWDSLLNPPIHFVQSNMLETANWINSATLFLGAASSCNTIAEGLGKPRFLQLAEDCFGTNPTFIINDWAETKILDAMRDYL